MYNKVMHRIATGMIAISLGAFSYALYAGPAAFRYGVLSIIGIVVGAYLIGWIVLGIKSALTKKSGLGINSSNGCGS